MYRLEIFTAKKKKKEKKGKSATTLTIQQEIQGYLTVFLALLLQRANPKWLDDNGWRARQGESAKGGFCPSSCRYWFAS
jgi:hypothetical protein